MTTLVVARGQRALDAVLAVLHDDGFDAVGTTADDEALTQLEAGGVMAVIIGGGVEEASREALRQVAGAHRATVIEGALGGRDVKTYIQQEIEPRLRDASRVARMATRRVIVQELVSVDGFVAGPSGGLEFFDAVTDYSEVDEDNLSVLGEVDIILLGRETYRLFVEYWPTAEGEPVADAVNSTPKIVFSSTLDSAPWGRWEPAQVRNGSAVDHVHQLRREPGRDVMVWGSISLVQSLLEAGMVDEIQLRVVPIVLGRGRSLITEDIGKRDLVLLEAKPYASGIVSLRYAVTRS